MIFFRVVCIFASFLYLGAPGYSQGSSCFTALSIADFGSFPYDTSSGLSTGFGTGTACVSGPILSNEKYFQWTAAVDGGIRISAPSISFRTHLAVFSGTGCAASCVDNGTFVTVGNQQISYLDIPNVQAGDKYLVQLGTRNGSGGPGVLTIEPQPCGSSAILDDSFEPNDSCSAAQPISPGFHTNLWTWFGNPDYYLIDVPPMHRLAVNAQSPDGPIVSRFGFPCPLTSGSGTGPWINRTGQVRRMVIMVEPQGAVGITPCRNYDLDVSVRFHPCADHGATNLNGERRLSTGFYPSLNAFHNALTRFCVVPGATLTLQLDLVRPDGILRAGLCDGASAECFMNIRFDSQSGRHLTFNWTNTTGADVELGLLTDWLGGPPSCNKFDLTVSMSSPCSSHLVTSDFCEPASINSAGRSTKLMASEVLGAWPALQLDAVHGPRNAFGFLLVGTGVSIPGAPIGNGLLCLDPSAQNRIGRFDGAANSANSIGRFDLHGRFEGVANGPEFGFLVPSQLPWGSSVQAGQTLYFQMWHRDGGGGSNFSNGVQVGF